MTWSPLLLSFQVALVAAFLCALLGGVLGGVLATRRFFGRDLLDAVLTAPMVMPPTVLGYYVLIALGRRSPLGRAWEALTGSPIVFTLTGAIVAATVGALPIAIKSARAAFEGVDPVLIDAARTLGASPLRAFATVRLPLAGRGLMAGIALCFARALGDFGITLMVAGDIPGQTQTASLAIFDLVQANQERAAMGMILLLTSLAVVALYLVNRLMAREAER